MIELLNSLPPHSFQTIKFQFLPQEKKSDILCETDVCFFFPSVLEEPPANILFFRVFPQNGPGGRKKIASQFWELRLKPPPLPPKVEMNSPRPPALSLALASEFLTLLSFSHIPRFATCAKKKKGKEKTKEFGEEKLRNLKPT